MPLAPPEVEKCARCAAGVSLVGHFKALCAPEVSSWVGSSPVLRATWRLLPIQGSVSRQSRARRRFPRMSRVICRDFLAAGRLAGCATGVETPKERDYGRGTHVESSQNRFEDTRVTLKPQEAPRATRNKRGKRPLPGRWRLERRRSGAKNSPRRRSFLPGRRAPGMERCRSS